MITTIEQALCARLCEGLGRMTNDVVNWNAMSGDIGQAMRHLPGVLVTFGGITDSRPHDTRRTRFRVSGRFSVFVADYNLRDNAAIRHGGVNLDEPGCYRLVRCVRRLLTGQDLGLDIGPLMPGAVRPVMGQALDQQAVAMYECVFSTHWFEEALENGRWPAPETDSEPDHDFVRWQGQLDLPYSGHRATHGDFLLQGKSVAQDTVLTLDTEKDDDEGYCP